MTFLIQTLNWKFFLKNSFEAARKTKYSYRKFQQNSILRN